MNVPITIEVMGQQIQAEVPVESLFSTLPLVDETVATTEDRHFYRDGENGLTLDQGARKITKRVMENIFAPARQDEDLDSYFTVYTATLAAMAQGVDRGFFYRLAGGIFAGYRDEGQYRGIPLSVVYAYRLRKILATD